MTSPRFALKRRVRQGPPVAPEPPVLSLIGTPEPNAVVDEPYAGFQVIAIGGVAPLTFDLTGEPAGLALSGSGSTRTVSGTPTEAGEFDLGVSVTDSADPPNTVALEITTLTVAAEAPVGDTASVSQFGISFNFGEDRVVGQYANGDYYVVGGSADPVTITSTIPAATQHTAAYTAIISGGPVSATGYVNRRVHGMQLNPGNLAAALAEGQANNAEGSKHGMDSLNQPDGLVSLTKLYDNAQNVDPGNTGVPLVLEEGSLVKCRSRLELTNDPGFLLLDQVVLTVVRSAPAAGQFRPPPAITDKSSFTWNKSHLDYSILPSLTAPSGVTVPDLDLVKSRLRRYYMLNVTDNMQARTITAQNNQQDYGRDIANDVNDGLLSLCLDYTEAEKEELYIYLVQLGIDVWGRLVAGGVFPGIGGGNTWRKCLLVLASQALKSAPGAATLATYAAMNGSVHGEDDQTFLVPRSYVDIIPTTADGRPRSPYLRYMVGQPDWKESTTLNRIGSNWNAYYRDIAGLQFIGSSLAMRLITGCFAAWNYGPFFDYADRYFMMQRINPQAGGTNGIRLFHSRMWEVYRHSGSAVASTVVGAGAHGAHVWIEYSDLLDFHSTPALADVAVLVNGAASTETAVAIFGKRLVVTIATPLVGGELVSISHTQGAAKLKNARLVDTPNVSGLAATNTTGELPPSAVALNTVQNFNPATGIRARAIVAVQPPVSQRTGIKRFLIGVCYAPRVTPTAGANIAANGNASGLRIFSPTPTTVRGYLGSSSMCSFVPVDPAPTGMQVHAFEADFTKADATEGRKYARNGVLAALSTGAWDSLGGTRAFNLASQVLSNGLAICGRPDGQGTVHDLLFKYLFFHFDDGTGPWKSLSDPAVAAGFAEANIGLRGEGPLGGAAPEFFWGGLHAEFISAEGVPNRGKGGTRPLVLADGTFLLV